MNFQQLFKNYNFRTLEQIDEREVERYPKFDLCCIAGTE